MIKYLTNKQMIRKMIRDRIFDKETNDLKLNI